MTCGFEDAGFVIRDCFSWVYGQGFPKSVNIGDELDLRTEEEIEAGVPRSEISLHWNGWGTGLKPGWEPIILARKPLDGTIAENILKHGTAALNIDGCRIGIAEGEAGNPSAERRTHGYVKNTEKASDSEARGLMRDRTDPERKAAPHPSDDIGRWPSNILFDEDSAKLLEAQAQGMSRFFYVAKPSRAERDEGCEGLPPRTGGEATDRKDGSAGVNNPRAGAGRTGGGRNHHPTVKPIALMQWLVKLVTPEDGIVINPFLNSGTTGMACRYESHTFIGIEKEADYVEIARRRITSANELFCGEEEVFVVMTPEKARELLTMEKSVE